MKFELEDYPLVMFDKHLSLADRSGEVSRELIKILKNDKMNVLIASSITDCLDNIAYSTNISGVILNWDNFEQEDNTLLNCLLKIKALNEKLPIFIITQTHELEDSETEVFKQDVDFFWKYADTLDFVRGRIKKTCINYLSSLLPPFFKALLNYSEQHKYAWHTPGHMGGIAFLKSPVGRIFYDFYGENVFRSDLSISAPELGSLAAHTGAHGQAERLAAQIFGADHTFFVTNGSSSSNKMVIMSCLAKNEVAIVDRNCHKSLQHALIMSDAIPIYFKPTRNAYGIIGTIPLQEFSQSSIKEKIMACPLISDKSIQPEIAIITNSTYDGLIYNVNRIKDELAKSKINNLHFDEAWYSYAHFHPIYNGKHAMSDYHSDYHPTVYSTQSTHKLLAAFSQASMIHIKDGLKPLESDLFNETLMMHSSTSPQYNMIASLDVASKMMEGQKGYRMVSESIAEAIAFRQEFLKIKKNMQAEQTWFFDLWQPQELNHISKSSSHHFMDMQEEDAHIWLLKPNEQWHGFHEMSQDYTMLDPIKVTVLTPGINHSCFEDFGIPAPIVSKYLMNNGVVDEKTSFYSMLFLFSIGVNKSKSMTLLSDFVLFKEDYDANTKLEDVFPDLVTQFPKKYREHGLKDLCHIMHQFLKHEKASDLLMRAFEILPEQVLTPNQAYQHVVKANGVLVPISELENKILLSMIAPYPPGIPIIMPGEKINAQSKLIIDYLCMLERFDNTFPGFENEIHGLTIKEIEGQRRYFAHCLSR